MTGYPLTLDVSGRRVLVVGGGRVAARRAGALAEAGALVHVIAPHVEDVLVAMPVAVHRRSFDPADLAGAWLVHACTDDPAVNAQVAAAAEARGVWCVRADAASESAAVTPAVWRDGEVTVAVTTGDPRRSAALRDAIGLAVTSGDLPLRRHRRDGRGHVALVGGGPGDPGLITVRGRRLLAEADVVVVDQLAPRSLLESLPPEVEIVDAGKSPHAHNLSQEQINAVLVDRARRGLRVVRLKGGDPFVFGRGGEEAVACVQAGVPFEVVPGVTSAVAVPAMAGIPVTHRGVTQDFAVVSAHLDPSHPGATVDWAALAAGPGTLVLLMAVAHLDAVTAELRKRGRPAGTPVAVVQDGGGADERVVTGTLADIATIAADAGIRPPAVVVVGDVVRLRDQLTRA